MLYINKLRLAKILHHRCALYLLVLTVAVRRVDNSIDEHIESICAVGVDEMSWDDLNEANYKWPTVEEARAYRNKARATVDNIIQTMELKLPITWDSPWCACGKLWHTC